MDVSLRRVVYVELCTLWREGEAVGIINLFGEQLELAVGSNAIDPLERNFLLLILRKIRSRIGKVSGSIGAEYNVVGAIQAFALVMIDDNIVFAAVRREADDRA